MEEVVDSLERTLRIPNGSLLETTIFRNSAESSKNAEASSQGRFDDGQFQARYSFAKGNPDMRSRFDEHVRHFLDSNASFTMQDVYALAPDLIRQIFEERARRADAFPRPLAGEGSAKLYENAPLLFKTMDVQRSDTFLVLGPNSIRLATRLAPLVKRVFCWDPVYYKGKLYGNLTLIVSPKIFGSKEENEGRRATLTDWFKAADRDWNAPDVKVVLDFRSTESKGASFVIILRDYYQANTKQLRFSFQPFFQGDVEPGAYIYRYDAIGQEKPFSLFL